VAALQDGIDPVGACVGMRGIRIQNIVKELHNEKIDVIEWNNDSVAFITKALSPARVTGVYLDDDPVNGRTAIVLVPEDQLSLAIGREGQNARLAAKLTGWRIDIKSVTETVQAALDSLEEPPLSRLTERYADMVAEALRIMEKKRLELAVMPEEYKSLARFASIVENILQDERDAQHERYRQRRDSVRATMSEQLFELPLDVLAVSQPVLDILEPYENIGEVMLISLIDESQLERKLVVLQAKEALEEAAEGETADTAAEEVVEAFARPAEDPLAELKAALDTVMAADLDQLLEEAFYIEDDEEIEADDAEAEASDASAELSAAETSEEAPETVEADAPEVLLDAFGQPIVEAEKEAAAAPLPAAAALAPAPTVVDAPGGRWDGRGTKETAALPHLPEEAEKEFELERRKSKKQRRKDRQKRRQLVLDEKSGEIIAVRRRKGKRNAWDEETWEDYDY